MLLEHKISADIKFSLEKLQQFIDQERTFGPCFCSCKSKGLVVYLEQLEVKLDQFIDYKDLKLYIFNQVLSELGILIPRNIPARNCIVLNDFEKPSGGHSLRGIHKHSERVIGVQID